MSNKEFKRLRQLESAKKNHPAKWNLRPSKRSVKSNGKGVGQVLRYSSVRSEVHLETIFPKYH